MMPRRCLKEFSIPTSTKTCVIHRLSRFRCSKKKTQALTFRHRLIYMLKKEIRTSFYFWQKGVGLPTKPFYTDRKSTRLNSSHVKISYAVFCLKKKKNDSLVNI